MQSTAAWRSSRTGQFITLICHSQKQLSHTIQFFFLCIRQSKGRPQVGEQNHGKAKEGASTHRAL